MPSHPSVKGSVFWVAVAEVILDQTEIVAPVGESEAAGVPEHVGMDVGQPGADRRDGDQIVDGLAGERLVPLGREQPRQPVGAGSEIGVTSENGK
jgi:hypothetical protein